MMKRLQDKFALITGGTSGIGIETARQFLAEGATVAITGRDEKALARAQAELGHSTLAFRCDAGDIRAQHDLAQALTQQWPRLDVLYANAGDVTHRSLRTGMKRLGIDSWQPTLKGHSFWSRRYFRC